MKTPLDVAPVHSLTDEEHTLLSEICAGGTVAVNVIATRPDDVLNGLYILARATSELEKRRSGLIHIVGKVLAICKTNPEIYHSVGYPSWEQFINKHVVGTLGMSRSTLLDALRVYKAFPTTSPKDVGEVGITKMVLLSRITNFTQPGHSKLIEAAKEQTYSQLMQVAAETSNLPPQEILRDTIVIPCTKATKSAWVKFSADPRVVSKCGSEDPGTVLSCMMAEVLVEWLQTE